MAPFLFPKINELEGGEEGMTKNKKGRPIKLTPELQEELVKVIRAGNYIETACAYVGINKTTFYDWLKRGAREKERLAKNPNARPKKSEAPFVELSNAIEKALAQAEIRDVAIIGKAAEENWQAAAWRLERKFPERWGRKERLTADLNHLGQVATHGQYEVRVEHNIASELLEDEEARELIKRLIRKRNANKRDSE
jgi:predicted aldo/keto reductase-like oxidoreductase